VIAMNELIAAGTLIAFLIGLAIAAPIWGVDSRDGVESDEPSRRASWLGGGLEPARPDSRR
jgi:hypothetical protein